MLRRIREGSGTCVMSLHAAHRGCCCLCLVACASFLAVQSQSHSAKTCGCSWPAGLGWLADGQEGPTHSLDCSASSLIAAVYVRTSVTLQCLHHMAVRVRGLSGHSMVARGHAAQVMVWALVLAVGSSWCNSCLCVLGDGRQLGHQCALRRTERDWRC